MNAAKLPGVVLERTWVQPEPIKRGDGGHRHNPQLEVFKNPSASTRLPGAVPNAEAGHLPSSGAQMRTWRSALIFAMAYVLTLGYAVPAEDAPDTAYDESELLPYEATPPFAIVMPKGVTESTPRSRTPSRKTPVLEGHPYSTDRIPPSPPVTNARIRVLDHSLRC